MFAKKKTISSFISSIFSKSKIQESDIDDIEDILLEADLGAKTVMEIVDEIRNRAKSQALQKEGIFAIIKEILLRDLKHANIFPSFENLGCLLVLGVNGVGKTTTIAKLGHYLKGQGVGTVLAAGDTFRAGATTQLELHGQRLGLRVISQGLGSDPGSVIFDALDSAHAKSEKLVLADTAGRLQNKANLIKELEKIHKIIKQKVSEGQYKKVMVLDCTTGRNGLEQARVFNEAVGLDGIILTKYDSQARGGLAHSICRELGLGIAFLGTGETYDDFEVFDPQKFVLGFIDD